MPTGCEHGRTEEDGCTPCEAWIDLKRENATLRAALEWIVTEQRLWSAHSIAREALALLDKPKGGT